MSRITFIFCLLSILAGCSNWPSIKSSNPKSDLRKQLNNSIDNLKHGQLNSSIIELENIVSAQAVMGLTDEALFRLSLLYLRKNSDKEGFQKSVDSLERIIKEFPYSPWTQLARPLLDTLLNYEEQRRQIRSIRLQNQTITRENKELRQSIERLKILDLELESQKKK